MRYPVMLCWVFLLSNAWAQENGDVLPAARAVVMATAADEVSAVPAPAWVPPAERTATFVVNYTGFSAEAEAAFQYAIDIWAGLITSSIPIVVNATWEDLPGNALGSAGSTGLWYNFTGAPFNNIRMDASIPIILPFAERFPAWSTVHPTTRQRKYGVSAHVPSRR